MREVDADRAAAAAVGEVGREADALGEAGDEDREAVVLGARMAVGVGAGRRVNVIGDGAVEPTRNRALDRALDLSAGAKGSPLAAANASSPSLDPVSTAMSTRAYIPVRSLHSAPVRRRLVITA